MGKYICSECGEETTNPLYQDTGLCERCLEKETRIVNPITFNDWIGLIIERLDDIIDSIESINSELREIHKRGGWGR